MRKEDCGVGMSVLYRPYGQPDKPEKGVVVSVREEWAMVLYAGDRLAKATYFSDLECRAPFVEGG